MTNLVTTLLLVSMKVTPNQNVEEMPITDIHSPDHEDLQMMANEIIENLEKEIKALNTAGQMPVVLSSPPKRSKQ